MTPPGWLVEQLGADWWRELGDRQFRLWLNLLALARPDGTGRRVDARLDDLVALCGASRDSVKATLARLSDLGMCRAAVSAGRVPGVVVLMPVQVTQPSTGARIIPMFPAKDLDKPSPSRDLDLQRPSTSDPDQVALPLDMSQNPGPARASRPPLGSESLPVSSPSTRDEGRDADSDAGDLQWASGYRAVGGNLGSEARTSRVPDRAWAAADWLRAKLLERDPRCALSRVAWSDAIGPLRSGRRLEWADEFRLINERDGKEWDEIARALHWVFHAQTQEPRYRIRVDSPGSLREKWDKIQEQRRRQQEQAEVRRGADGRPDPQAARPTKTWTGGE